MSQIRTSETLGYVRMERESSATMNGGTFGDATAAETTYTPAIAGTVILSLTVADDAQQAVTVIASGGRHRVAYGEAKRGAQAAARWTGSSRLAGPGKGFGREDVSRAALIVASRKSQASLK